MMHPAHVRIPRDRYTRVAVFLHWAIAAFIVFNLCSGVFIENWLHGQLKDSVPAEITWMSLVMHVSSGLSVLALTVGRVVWRLLNKPPPHASEMKPWERHTANLTHFLLYAAMVLMPVTGWAILSAHPPAGSRGASTVELPASGPPPGLVDGVAPAPGVNAPRAGTPRDVKIWNMFPMPAITPIEAIGKEPGGVAPQHVLHEEFAEWHRVGAYLVLSLLALHILGALKHQFIDGRSEFARMGIGRRPS